MMTNVEQTIMAGVVAGTPEDPTLLLVKGVGANSSKEDNASYVKGLSIAILTVFQKHEIVRLRCIGKGAIGNAVYAHAQANIELAKQGLVLVATPVYKTVSLDGVGDRTAIVIELTALEEDTDENGNK